MKKYLTILFFLVLNIGACLCQDKFDITKYVGVEFGIDDYNGQKLEYTSPYLIEVNDSIGIKIKENHRRYEYLLSNKINLETVNTLKPDTIKAREEFKKIINKDHFKDYFYETYYNHNIKKATYTKDEIMNIASKFFLTEKYGDNYSTRICVGINGFDSKNDIRDNTLAQALMFEAIFDKIMHQNDTTTAEINFMKNLDNYQAQAIKKSNDLN